MHVLAVLREPDENARQVVEEGGEALSWAARSFIERASREIALQAVLSPEYSIEDLKLNPFARADGGAHLLVDFGPTDKRLSLHVLPSGKAASLTLTGPHASRSEPIVSPGDVARHLKWLTSTDA